MSRAISALLAAGLAVALAAADEPPESVREMVESRRDLWGEAAARQPGGPSYAFFRDLLQPVRYVNAEFRHYPVVLCAPRAAVKARWVSNGSAVNARANKKPMWREVGFPVQFAVGGGEAFGADPDRLDGPRYAEGWLPVVQVAYQAGAVRYDQEAFAPVRGTLAERGAVFLRFSARGLDGALTARVGFDGPVTAADGAVTDGQGRALVLFDSGWQWDAGKQQLAAKPAPDRPAVLAVLTQPLPAPHPALTAELYAAERAA